MPLHPRTRLAIDHFGLSTDGITIIDPIGYLDMTQLLSGAAAVYTDSGGLQKEAYFHRVPCVTLRDETEWVETVLCGWNRLWGEDSYRPRKEILEYGDGQSSQKIVDLLRAV
jgi:UDP-GlcNAc3NAcA epimerase